MLFHTSINMPLNLIEGESITCIFLTRDDTVVSEFENSMQERKVGLEQFLFRLSWDNPFGYENFWVWPLPSLLVA